MIEEIKKIVSDNFLNSYVDDNKILKFLEISNISEKSEDEILVNFKNFLFNDYISTKITCSDKLITNLETLNNLIIFLDKIDLIVNEEILMYDEVYKIIETIVNGNLNLIKNGDINLITNNIKIKEIILSFINNYTNIKIDKINETDCNKSDFNILSMYLNDINMPIYTKEKLADLDRRILSGDESAREEYVLGNLRLVVCIARKFYTGFLDINDLISAGNIGLIRASKGYEPSKKSRFTTYAVFWITHAIRREIETSDRLVRLPSGMQYQIKNVKYTANKYISKFGKQPTYEELSELTGISKKRIIEILIHDNPSVSLNAVIGDDENEFQETFAADINIEKSYSDNDMVQYVFSMLSDVEQKIFMYRYGFYDGEPKTLEQVGQFLGGLSRERVRQIEARALKKIRRVLKIDVKKKKI